MSRAKTLAKSMTLERYTLFTHQRVNNTHVYFEGLAGSLKSPGAELLTLIYRPRLNYAGQNLSNPHSQERLHGVRGGVDLPLRPSTFSVCRVGNHCSSIRVPEPGGYLLHTPVPVKRSIQE